MNLQEYLAGHGEVAWLFSDLTGKQMAKMEIRIFQKGEPLVVSGEKDENFYVILEGVADVMNDYDSGQRLACSKIARGDVVGFYGIIAPGIEAEFTIIAHNQVVAAYLSGDDAKELASTHSDFLYAAGRRFIQRLYSTTKLLAECGVHSLYHAAITYLLYSCRLYATSYPEGYEGPVRIDESRQNMADFLGVDVRSVNRAIERLKKENLVSIIKGKVHINAAQLRRMEEARRMEN